MPETAIAAPDSATGAGLVSQSIPTGGDGASQTDDAILGITEDVGAVQTAETTTEAAQPQQQEPAQQTVEQTEPAWKKEAEEEGLFLTEAPPELKALFADPKVGKLVQSAWDSRMTAQAYREFIPTLKEARMYRESFPGGVDQMQRVVSEARESQLTDLAFYSKDPQMQGQLSLRLLNDDKAAFLGQLKASNKVLAENDPEAYAEVVSEIEPRVYEAQNFAEYLQSAEETLRAKNGDHALSLLQHFVQWANGKGIKGQVTQRLDPERLRFQREQQDFNKQRDEARQSTWQNVSNAANNSIMEQVKATIGQKISALFPASFKLEQTLKDSLVGKVFDAIDAKLKQDVSLVQPYQQIKNRVLQSGRATESDQREITSLIVNRATQMFPLVARSVINEWTRNTIALNKSNIQKRETAATRRDISSGGTPSHKPKTLSVKDVRSGGAYARMSDREILDL